MKLKLSQDEAFLRRRLFLRLQHE